MKIYNETKKPYYNVIGGTPYKLQLVSDIGEGTAKECVDMMNALQEFPVRKIRRTNKRRSKKR